MALWDDPLAAVGGAVQSGVGAVGSALGVNGGDAAAQQAAAAAAAAKQQEADAAAGNFNGDYAAYYNSLTPEQYAERTAAEARAAGPTYLQKWETTMPGSYNLGGDANAANAYAAQAQQTGAQAANKLNQAAAMSQGVSYEMGSQLAAAGQNYGEAIAGQSQQLGYNLAQTGQNYGEAIAGQGAQSGYNLSQYGQGAAADINQTGSAAQQYGQGAAADIASAGARAQMIGGVQNRGFSAQGDAAQQFGYQSGQQLGAQGNAAQQYGSQQAGALQQAGQVGQNFGFDQSAALGQQGQQANQYGLNQAGQLGQTASQLGQMGQGVFGQAGAAANRNIIGQQQQAIQGIEAREGPSAAQAQLQAGLNQSQASNIAMARSGRGWGGSAAAMGQAQQQNAAAGQNAANQSAMLRAQEDAAYRSRAAQNIGAAAQMGLSQANTNDAQQRALLAAGLQGVQAGGQMQAQAAGLGQNAYAQQLAAQQASAQTGQAGIGQSLAAQQAAAGIGQQGYAQQLAAQQAGVQAGQQGYAQQLAAQQAGAQSLQFGVGQNLAAQQAAAGVGQAGYGQNLAAQQAAGSLGVNAMQAGGAMSLGALESGGNMALQGQQAGGAMALGGLQTGGGMAMAGIEGGGNMQLGGLAQSANQSGQAALVGLDAQQQAMAAQQQQVANQMAYQNQMISIHQGNQGVQMNNANNQAAAGQASKDRIDKYAAAGINFAGQMIQGVSDRDKKKEIEPANREMLVPPADTSGNGGPGGYAFGTGISGPNQSQADASNGAAQAARAQAQGNAKQAGIDEAFGKFGGRAQGFAQDIGQSNGFRPNRAPMIQSQPVGIPQPGYQDMRGQNYQSFQLSDEDEKKSIEAIEKTHGYSFEYKDPNQMGAKDGLQFGIMAQDLEKTPAGRSVVKKQPDGTRMVDTSRLTMVNTAALNAMSKEIDALKARAGARQ